jgi:F-type H+-transporting ATPase subunit epsilon
MNVDTRKLKPELKILVISPQRRIYEGPAVSITAKNKVGPFDVLAGHANFFSLLTASNVVVDIGTQKLKFPINRGLLKVKANTVTLFVDIEQKQVA